MSRVKGGTTRVRRHRKIKKQAKGFRGHRGRTFRGAKEGVLHALTHSFRGRKLKKRRMRSLWIIRINALARQSGSSYSEFIHKLKEKDIHLNRKVLNDIAINDSSTLEKIVHEVIK